MNAEKDAKEKAENEAEKYNFLQHPEPRTESVADFKKRMMRTAHKLEENDDTRYF